MTEPLYPSVWDLEPQEPRECACCGAGPLEECREDCPALRLDFETNGGGT